MKKRLTALLTAAVLLFSGCKENTESSNNSYNVNDFTIADTQKEGKSNVYLIVKSNNAYFRVMFEAAKDAAKDLDCNVYYSGSEESSQWEVQVELMDMAMKNGADAVILAPDDTTKLADKVSELYAAGISVIFVDAVVNTNNYDVCYMTDNLVAGQTAAKEMLRQLKENGLSESEPAKIAIQVGRLSSQTVNERLAGFTQYWTQNAPKNWVIIDELKANDGNESKALPIAEEYFKQYEGIKGVFGTNNASTKGFAKYMISNNIKDVVIVGFDYSSEMDSLVNDSSCRAAIILQNQYDMAYKGIQAALEIKNGTFTSGSKLIDTGVIAVNNENINDPKVKEIIAWNS